MQRRPASVLRVLLGSEAALGRTEAQQRLAELGATVECALEAPEQARWALGASVEGLSCQVWMEPTPPLDLGGAVAAGLIDEDQRRAARDSSFSVLVRCVLGERPLRDFHTQLRVLARLAPAGVLIVDECSRQMHPPQWLQEVAASSTPPSPRALYALHAVSGDGRVWIHSHGLPRCGCVDLDLLEVPVDDWRAFVPLAQAVAARWIELGPPPQGEVFEPGHGIALLWLPWRAALAKVKPVGPGGSGDRDEAHGGPRAVLFAAERTWTGTKPRPIAALAPRLNGDPILYVTDGETERMALLAAERLPRFAALLARHGAEEGWRFLAKLGYPRDGGDEAQREHLWFEVHALHGDGADATLLSEPYDVRSLRPGERGVHDLGLLSDWLIIAPWGEFGPDEVGALEAAEGLTH